MFAFRIAFACITFVVAPLLWFRVAEAACTDDASRPVDLKACLDAWHANSTRPKGLSADRIKQIEDLELLDDLKGALEAFLKTKADGSPVSSLRAEISVARPLLDRKLRDRAFSDNACGENRVWCLDRDGKPFDSREHKPQLFADDRLTVLVLSYLRADEYRFILSSRTIRDPVALFAPSRTGPAGSEAPSSEYKLGAKLETQVEVGARRIEIFLERKPDPAGNDALKTTETLAIELRKHLVEFGVALEFLYDRNVSARGAVSREFEPDLAFTISFFPAGRISDQPLQECKSWFGMVVGADVTNPIGEKRFYAGLDFSPVGGIALNLGIALAPWEYIPPPETVNDLLSNDLVPDTHYHPSFSGGLSEIHFAAGYWPTPPSDPAWRRGGIVIHGDPTATQRVYARRRVLSEP
jgi:hypothetical protein